ncbi:MAG: cytochrome c biogenesis protein CcdA [Candidatus Kerfeldbacteria bacterium]|nr:cytochrome c biogenesis protein CcdA [Candidatus Kerfeldbacteria bacterium]
MSEIVTLTIPAFIAGLLTFFAPCTLPLTPGYLAFISGVSLSDLQNQQLATKSRRRILLNGLLYVLGFSIVMVLLGSLFGLGGSYLIHYRLWLARLGGIAVIFFGLFMLGLSRFRLFRFMNFEKTVMLRRWLHPGQFGSSFLFGATFAFGWTPCIGPVLGSVLLLASQSATLFSGAMLLAVFSLGLGIPFMIIAATVSSATRYLSKLQRYLSIISKVGGAFLVLLGTLMVLDKTALWTGFVYQFFGFIHYDQLLDYL